MVALLTALSFIALVSTAVTHYHGTSQETQDCSICAVVADKIGSANAPAALIAAQLFVLFSVVTASLRNASYANSELLPPSCGPPDYI